MTGLKKWKCKVCNSSDIILLDAFESLFGTNEKFEYYECKDCGLVWLNDIITDYSPYYKNYYSFESAYTNSFISSIKNILTNRIYSYLVFQNKNDVFGRCLYQIFRSRFAHSYLNIFSYIKNIKSNIDLETKILDYWCWNWDSFIKNILKLWFKNIYGIDPFLLTSTDRILKNIKDYNGKKFDIITLFHSLEHIEDPLPILIGLKESLEDDGLLIVELPIKSIYLWNLYRENYYPLDPPRHIYLYSLEALFLLFANVGLNIQGFIWKSPIDYIIESNRKLKKDIINPNELKNITAYLDRINNSENYCFILKKK